MGTLIQPISKPHHSPEKFLECRTGVLGDGKEQQFVRFDHNRILVPSTSPEDIIGPIDIVIISILLFLLAFSGFFGTFYRLPLRSTIFPYFRLLDREIDQHNISGEREKYTQTQKVQLKARVVVGHNSGRQQILLLRM